MSLAHSRGVKVPESWKTPSKTVSRVIFAVFFGGIGVVLVIGIAMGWETGPGPGTGGWYVVAASYIVVGGLGARSVRKATWADRAGLRVRGMLGMRVMPWSQVRYFRFAGSGNGLVVEAVLLDDSVRLAGTEGHPDRTRQLAADLMAFAPSKSWLAIGLDLTSVPSARGSRQTALLVTEQLRCRAEWSLPGANGTVQAGAPLLCCPVPTLVPGASARAVIIPLTDAHMSEWRLLGEGDQLRLVEGLEVRCRAVVRWSETTTIPVPLHDIDRYSRWSRSSDGGGPMPA